MEIQGTLGDRAGLGALKNALEAYALRHRVIAGNIANAEVAGYRPKQVEFEKYAEQAMANASQVHLARTDPGHLPPVDSEGSIPSRVVEEPAGPDQETGVDLEKEIVAMVENQLSYRLAVRLLDMKYNQLHSAITGRSR
jgi:flagellar basal-body rod protein FlgB